MDASQVIADILNLSETEPEKALIVIDELIKNKDLETFESLQFCKARAFQTKGLKPVIERPWIQIKTTNREELMKYLVDDDLNNLELALSEYKKIEDSHPDFVVECLDREWWEDNIEGMGSILERCRPGMVQTIMRKTKFSFFGLERILDTPQKSKRISPELLKPYLYTWFEYPSIVKSAMIFDIDFDSKGRRYVEFWLFGKTIDDFLDDETFGEAKIGTLYIYDDKQYSLEPPEKPLENNNIKQKSEPNPKKGIFKNIFGK